MYKQVDGVAMGNPLGPVIANIFMVELENKKVPTVSNVLSKWQRYVGDTIDFMKEDQVNNVLETLNKHHKDIKFTDETEENNELPFSDVLLRRTENNKLLIKFYRKKTCSNIYIHWKAFAPDNWKIGTLKCMFRRAYLICSVANDLKEEIKLLSDVFRNINEYPRKIIDRCHREMKKKFSTQQPTVLNIEASKDPAEVANNSYMLLPYAGPRGEKVLKKLRKRMPNARETETKNRV